jgi:hypothetical protein
MLWTYVMNFRNELECLSPHPRKHFQFSVAFVDKAGPYRSETTMVGWKGLPGTNTQDYYEHS